MSGETVYARGGDNILAGVTPTATVAPSSTYSLATLALMQPAERVRWGVTSVALTFTLGSSKQGDVLVIPAHNLDAGVVSPAVLTLSNGSGLSVPVSVPANQGNGLPNTIVVDLTALADAATRTSGTWVLTIAGNSVNVTLGGAIAIFGPKRVLDPDLRWNFNYKKRHGANVTQNEYLARYVVNLRTAQRSIVGSVRTSDLATVEAWFDENAGGTAPSLLWPQVTGLDAYLGIWEPDFSAVIVEGSDYYDVSLTFSELSKGKPVV